MAKEVGQHHVFQYLKNIPSVLTIGDCEKLRRCYVGDV